MERFKTLMLREWLQHRLGWSLLAGIPLALALLLSTFAQIEIDAEDLAAADDRLPMLATLVAMAAGAGMIFLILWLTSLLLMSNLARRDHGDRSNEFWHSLPVGHVPSLAVPLGVHLLLVPAAGLAVGMLGGWLVSAVVVTRLSGFGAWITLPWLDLLPVALAVMLRLLAGLPLALLWLSPLLLAVILAQAWLRRWGLVALLALLGVGGTVLEQVFGQPMLRQFITTLLMGAGRAVSLRIEGGQVDDPEQAMELLRLVPAWAWEDYTRALAALASPSLALGLLMAVVLFLALLDWRRRFGSGQ